MAGEEPTDIPKLTGLQKYFNSYTARGRANVVLFVWSTTAIAVIYFKYIKPSKKRQE